MTVCDEYFISLFYFDVMDQILVVLKKKRIFFYK
jgi:hypothetical protein